MLGPFEAEEEAEQSVDKTAEALATAQKNVES